MKERSKWFAWKYENSVENCDLNFMAEKLNNIDSIIKIVNLMMIFLVSDLVSEVSAWSMESSISSTHAKSVEGNKSDLSIVDGMNCTEERSIVCSFIESTASIYPNILIIALRINECWDFLGSLGLSEVLLLIKINVVGCHFLFLIINYYY